MRTKGCFQSLSLLLSVPGKQETKTPKIENFIVRVKCTGLGKGRWAQPWEPGREEKADTQYIQKEQMGVPLPGRLPKTLQGSTYGWPHSETWVCSRLPHTLPTLDFKSFCSLSKTPTYQTQGWVWVQPAGLGKSQAPFQQEGGRKEPREHTLPQLSLSLTSHSWASQQ